MDDAFEAPDVDEEDGGSEAEEDFEDSEGADETQADADGETAISSFDLYAKEKDTKEYLGLPPHEQLAKWHGNQKKVEADLIKELDGTNLFFINAESLICDAITSREVAFQEEVQFLRMIYAIEQRLAGIAASGGLFRLIFFDGLRKFLTEAFGESVWALRQAFLVHCRTSNIDCAVFSHFYAEEWKAHISQWRPSFLLSSCETLDIQEEEDEEEEEEEAEASEEDKERKKWPRLCMPEVFHALALSFLSSKTQVAILRGLQRHGRRIMAFSLEVDCHNTLVDSQAKAALLPLLTESAEEEDEDEGAEEEEEVAKSLQKFAKASGDKVSSEALLRSFLAVRFVSKTLAMCEGQNKQTSALMQLFSKILILHEMMQRQIPLDKRATTMPAHDSWEFYEERIMTGLERYFTLAIRDLGKLVKEPAGEGIHLDACDLFDGRLYRFIFNVVVDQGLRNKGKVDAAFLGLQPWVEEELTFLWKQASKEKFFPITCDSLLKFPGIEPPEMPEKEKPRTQPTLHLVENSFMSEMWEGIGKVEDQDEDVPEAVPAKLWEQGDKQINWTLDKQAEFHSILEEERMEENEAEKKLKLKFENKAKITAKDLEFKRNFYLRRKQQALKALDQYASSLTDSRNLHPPIIMKDESAASSKAAVAETKSEVATNKREDGAVEVTFPEKWKVQLLPKEIKDMEKKTKAKVELVKTKEAGNAMALITGKDDAAVEACKGLLEAELNRIQDKINGTDSKTAKHVELLEKKSAEEAQKAIDTDKEKMKVLDPKVEALADISDLVKFEQMLLDIVLGYGRITDSFVGFPAITSALQLPDMQGKILVKVVKSCRSALKKMKLDDQPESARPQVVKIIRHIFCMVQEAFNSYGKDLDGKAINSFQQVLCSLGFPQSAAHLFERWKAAKTSAMSQSLSEMAAAAAAAPEKEKGKDDKKKGKDKDEKKDDKKDDKKDKKDKKDGKDSKSSKKGKEEEAPPVESLSPEQFQKELESHRVSKDVEMMWSGMDVDEWSFQLLHLGPYMTRTVGTAKDDKKRVMFKPDRWQRDLLDIVDDKKSALVSAPTASGKTFIGYYVMDSVLRESNDGVAVYVAPSKALVNQVTAEIYARFSSKTYPNNSKYELLGVFLREFNSAGGYMEQGKWKNCQVLVTIPHILEMLLLSPHHQDWVQRLRWVVFDEVHCIGEQEDGLQWEHCMQMIPCPFIALSATVASPASFHGWLQKVNEDKQYPKVEFVQHTERWNDLYKFMVADGVLRPLHPFCCLTEKSVMANGMAADMSLTPQEMVLLFLEVQKLVPDDKLWATMSPQTYFADRTGGFITKREAREYEGRLKEAFLSLLREGKLQSDAFSTLQYNLQKASMEVGGTAQATSKDPTSGKAAAEAETASATGMPAEDAGLRDLRKMNKSQAYLVGKNVLNLCRTLDNMQYLPALVFNFNRKEVEAMLKKLLKELKDRQHDKYYGDEEATQRSKKIMEKRWREYNEKKAAYDQAQKMKASQAQEISAQRKDKAAEENDRLKVSKETQDASLDMLVTEPVEPIDIADEIDPEFSFHNAKALGQWQEDIASIIKEVKFKMKFQPSLAQMLIDGLQRGIGMHHEGLPKIYRQSVEILFRRGYLKVVFATGTLALGINMPCRSTIFCGESLDLNGLMFRQMSGRAGRRGFDLLGQVVFLDMHFFKVRRLVSSDLPTLSGQFVMPHSAVLRALESWESLGFNKDEGEDEAAKKADKYSTAPRRTKEDFIHSLMPMCCMPFFNPTHAGVDSQDTYKLIVLQAKYFARFSVEFLLREGIIDRRGTIRNTAKLVSHMFEVEPANFVLSRLLLSGKLHEYLQKEAPKERKAERRTHLTVKLMRILAWLLCRKRLPESFPQRAQRKKYLPSQECPRLPPLPPEIMKVVLDYNNSTFELFQQLAWSIASTNKFDADDFMLPCSRGALRKEWDQRGNPFLKESKFSSLLIKQLIRFRARAPLAAIAGAGDHFRSPYDLVSSLRPVVQLNLNALPLVPPDPFSSEDAMELEPTNSYALDFMYHGSFKYLWEDNGINQTKAYVLVKAILDAVVKMISIMKVYATPDDIVVKTFEQLAAELKARQHGASSG